MLGPHSFTNISVARCTVSEEGLYLSKGGALALRLDGDGVGSSLQDLVDVFLTKLGTFVFLVHQSSVRSLSQEVFDLFLGQLLDLNKGSKTLESPCKNLQSVFEDRYKNTA